MASSGIPHPRERTSSPTHQTCVTPSGLTVITYVGDIFTVRGADGIVTGEGASFEQDSFITKTLIERLEDFETKRRELQRKKGPFKPWIVRTTKLNSADDFRVVFHAMLEHGSSDKWVKNMTQLYKEVFRKAEKYQVKTLVLPVLGTGRGKADIGDAVRAIVTAVIRCQNSLCLQTVYLTTRETHIAEMMSTQFQYQFSSLSNEKVKVKRSFLGCTSSKTSDSFKEMYPPQQRPRRRSEPKEEYDKSNGFKQEQPSSMGFSRRQENPNKEQSYSSGRFSSKERAPLQADTHSSEPLNVDAYRNGPKEDYDNINGFNQEQRPPGSTMHPEGVGRNDDYCRRHSGRGLESGEHRPTRSSAYEPAILDTGNETKEHERRSTSRTFPISYKSPNKEQGYASDRLSRKERAPLKEEKYSNEYLKADTHRSEPLNADTYRNEPVVAHAYRSDDATTKADVTRHEHNEITIEVEYGQRVVETSRKERKVPEFNDKRRHEAITTGKSNDPDARNDTNEDSNVRHVAKEDVSKNHPPTQTHTVPDLEHRKGTKLNSSVDASPGDAFDEDNDNDGDDFAAATAGDDEGSPGMHNVNKVDGQNCPICISPMTDPKYLDKCGHAFCRDCIDNSFKHFKPVCPSCNMVYGILTGNQPDGTMDVDFIGQSLPGYKNNGMIIVIYHFPDGIQGPNHPHPGQPFEGTSRRGFLPDCTEGKEVLSLLRTAFDRKLTFTIGRSTTTGQDNVVTWNDIHHKTRLDGGPTK